MKLFEHHEDVVGSEEERIISNSERILKSLGLKMEDLKNKTVLDVGSGPDRFLEKRIKKENINAKVVSYDIEMKDIEESLDLNKTAVQGDILESGLPFKNNSFDSIVSVGGPTGYGPYHMKEGITLYNEMLDALKPDGELRIFNPFLLNGGIAFYLYDQVRIEQIENLEKEFLEKMVEPDDHLLRDKEGWIVPLYDGETIWLGYLESFSKEKQKSIYETVAHDMQNELDYKTEVNFVESRPEDKNYNPCMIMKKL